MKDITEEYMEAFLAWVKNVKGITGIDILDLADLMPEYEKWLENQKPS